MPATACRDAALHHAGYFYHRTERCRDGTPVRCRTNGKCKTWKTRPDDFRLPVKWGLRVYFYITPLNADQWEISDEDWARVQARVRRATLCEALGVSLDIPDGALRDLAEERGAARNF